jgi:cation diffusion facilitator CzcD-associated flavoprotein CzcO
MGEYTPEALGRVIGSNTATSFSSSNQRPVHFDEWSQPLSTGYYVADHTIGEQWGGKTGEPFKIVMMGAGAAGIDFLHHAPKALADFNVEIKCFEKNADVGGTWYENRYPGCACDGPSASYQFAWRPNPDWSRFYSGSREIWQYLKGIAVDEGLLDYIQLSTEVKKASWNDEKGKWALVLAKTDGSKQWEEECNVFLNGTGFLK